MTVHDGSDGSVYSFAHIARVIIKGDVIGGSVIRVISTGQMFTDITDQTDSEDDKNSVIEKTPKSGVGVCESDRAGLVTHAFAYSDQFSFLNYVCDVAFPYSQSPIIAVVTGVWRGLCATFCGNLLEVLHWCAKADDLNLLWHFIPALRGAYER
jgi:hypothetical protein